MIWIEQYGGWTCSTLSWLRDVDSFGMRYARWSTTSVRPNRSRWSLTRARRRPVRLYCQRNALKSRQRLVKALKASANLSRTYRQSAELQSELCLKIVQSRDTRKVNGSWADPHWPCDWALSPVSLANITGGPECASARWLRGYLVLLNKCKTMQIKPASTAIPVETPRSVGRSDPMTDISVNKKSSSINCDFHSFADWRHHHQVLNDLILLHLFVLIDYYTWCHRNHH